MLSVGGILGIRKPGAVLLKGTVDATLAANLAVNPTAGDRYTVSVAGDFELSGLILPAGATFNVGDQITWQLDGSGWLKSDATENIINDAYGVGWSGDVDNTASRNAIYDKLEADALAWGAALQAEEDARILADGVLQTNIDAEAATRLADDATLQANIDAEAATRLADDATLQANIDAEAATRLADDATLQANIDAEAATRLANDAILQGNIDTTDANLAQELLDRDAADVLLQANIDAEAATRLADDTTLQANIDAEAATRLADDTTLQANIDAEAATRLADDTTLQANIDAEALTRLTDDNLLSARISEMEGDGSFSGTELILKNTPGVVYELNLANMTTSLAPVATTYPAKTVTGTSAFEVALTDATENVQAFTSPQALTFSGCTGATFMGIKKVAGSPLANCAKVVRVEVSDDGKTFVDQDSPEYFDNYFQLNKATWADGTFIYYPVNKLNKAYVRVTLDGGDSSSWAVMKLQFAGFAGLGSIQQWDLASFDGTEDIDPYAFKSDSGDRWLFLTSSAGGYGTASELIHETDLRTRAVLNNVTAVSVLVAGVDQVEAEIGSYANTAILRPGEFIARPGEQIDLVGEWMLNGIPLDYQTLDLAGANTLEWDKALNDDHWTTAGETVSETISNGWDLLFAPAGAIVGTATGGVMTSGGSNSISIATTSVITVQKDARLFFVSSELMDTVGWVGGDLNGQQFDYLGNYGGQHVYRFKADSSVSETATTFSATRAAGSFTARITNSGYHPFDLSGLEVKDLGVTMGKLSTALQAKFNSFAPETIIASAPAQTVFNFSAEVSSDPLVAIDGVLLPESEYSVTGSQQITLVTGVPVSSKVMYFVTGTGGGEGNDPWASTVSAEAGISTTEMMNPFTTKKAIDKFAGTGGAYYEVTTEPGSLLSMTPFTAAPTTPQTYDFWIRKTAGQVFFEWYDGATTWGIEAG